MSKKYHLQYTAKDGSPVDTQVYGNDAVSVARAAAADSADGRVNCWPVTPPPQ